MDRTKSQCVYIIVLNWEQGAVTIECVQSLMTLAYPNCRIVVVDNGSHDSSAERLRERFGEQIDLIASPENTGFSGGNNLGIRHALGHSADYVMLINNDTIVNDTDLIGKLVDAAESDPCIGLVSPSIHRFDAPSQVWYAGAALSLWTGWKHHYRVPKDQTLIDTGYASGCCVLASVKMIEEIGLLKEPYFLTVEDIEWSLRARQAGWRVVYVPGASLLHKESTSSKDRSGAGMYSPTRVYYEHRNAIWLVREYGNSLQRWIIWPTLFALIWIYKISGYILLRRWPKLRALLRAIRDGLLASPAKCSHKM